MAYRCISTILLRNTKQAKYLRSCAAFKETNVNLTIRLQPKQCLHVKVYDEEQFKNKRNTRENEVPNKPLYDTTSKIDNEYFQNAKKLDEDFVATKDPDIFDNTSNETLEDEGDVIEETYLQNAANNRKKLRQIDYARLIKRLLNERRLKDALDVLDNRMLKVDRVKPENYIYNLLISGCAKDGYTRKAFKLFNKMRQRSLKVKPGTYTSLFNACANAPTIQDGLNRANYLRELMLEEGYEPNVKNYNAMIKAYGHCGDVKTAFLLADEMKERNLELTTETFNFLLQACASDKKFGFRQCIDTWHKMLKSGLTPDYYTFCMVLRCVRDCGIGEVPAMKQYLSDFYKAKDDIKLVQETKVNQNTETERKPSINSEISSNPFKLNGDLSKSKQTTELQSTSSELDLPNLLMPQPHLGSLISIEEIKYAHDRFLLIGGMKGYFQLMNSYKVVPDIKLFTTMLEVIPPTKTAEKQIISWIQKLGLKADIDFFNILMKKRSLRFDYEGAKEILTKAEVSGLKPDIVTYGILALGCQTADEARELLQTMKQKGVRMNVQILGAMLRQATSKKLFPYVNEIIQLCLDENIKPNDTFLRHLHNFQEQNAGAIDARLPYTKSKVFKKEHAQFCKKLRFFYEENGISGLKLRDAIKKVQERPYEHYKESDVEGLEDIKNEKKLKKLKVKKHVNKIKLSSLSSDENEEVKTTIAA